MINVIFDFDSGRKKAILTSDCLQEVREFFSVEDKTQKFKRRFSVGWRPSSRIYAITPQGRFDLRLHNEILRYIKSKHVTCNVEYTSAFKTAGNIPRLDSKIVTTLKIPLRDYQLECVEQALDLGSGVIVLPTSAGKTLVMATLVSSIQDQLSLSFKTLILVPDLQLVMQSCSDFIEYGIDESRITKWTGSHEPNPDASIIVANSQILLSEKQDTSILKNIQLLVIDEVHKLKQSNKISKLVAKIPAKMRYGLTGTMPDENIDKWHIIGQLGDIIYKKKSIDLRELNYISSVRVVILKMMYANAPYIEASNSSNPTAAYEQELEFLQHNKFRNKTIQTLADSLTKNTLILVDRIVHGEILLEQLKANTKKEVYFICGSVELEERERVRNLMETNDNVVCVAISKIFSTGVNIRNLHYIVFASIGKAKIKIIQSIGRSLRLHSSKKQATIFDIGDDMRYGNNHLFERISLYDSESIPHSTKIIKEPNENNN